MQHDLFSQPAPAPKPEEGAAPYPLYPFQGECVAAVERELWEVGVRGTLALMATGLGKTQVACELIRRRRGRCLFVAHRSELIDQASKRIEQFTGQWPDIEQASLRANAGGYNHVVASVQTLYREKRLTRFDPAEFDLIIIDEVHHGVARTYRAIIDYFTGAKLVGLTATPDRGDGEALGQILDSVAYRYEISEAIADGWLAPVRIQQVAVDSIDLSGVHTVAGDFNKGELDKVMSTEEALHGVAKPAIDLCGTRPTIVFATSVNAAHRLSEVLDRYAGRPIATAVDGSMPKDERREALRLYESGERQFLVNVGIATEGYDHPPTSAVVMGRPTKSRALYAQMLGRGTRGGPNRPIPGKDDCLVLDFKGNASRHDVVSAADALAGDISDQGIEALKDELEQAEAPMSVEEALEKARKTWLEQRDREEAAKRRREHIQGEVVYRSWDANPYVALNVKRDYLHERYGYAPATEQQRAMLEKAMGKNAGALPEQLGKKEASRLIGEIVDRRKSGLCTYKQLAVLAKNHIDGKHMSFEGAGAVMDALAKNRWQPLPPGHAERIAAAAQPRRR